MAITQDAHTNLGNNNAAGSTLSHSHVMGSVSNGVLIVGLVGDLFGGADDITSVKWNTSESLTLIGKRVTDSSIARFTYLYYLLNPTAGTHNVDVVMGSTHYVTGFAASYSGVSALDQSATLESISTTDPVWTLTGVASNAACLLVVNSFGQGPTSSTGATLLDQDANLVGAMFESSPLVTSGGTVNLTTHSVGNTAVISAAVMASFSPVGSGAIPDSYGQDILGTRAFGAKQSAFRARAVYSSSLQRQDQDAQVNAQSFQYPDMGVTGVYLPREPIAARQAWLQFMFGRAQDESAGIGQPDTYTQPVIGVTGIASGQKAWIRAVKASAYGWVPALDVPVLVVTPVTYTQDILGSQSLRWNLQRRWINAQIASRYGWQVEVPPAPTPTPFVGIDPVIMLQISRDGGHTWEAPIAAPIGATGKYDDVNRPAWFQLGRVRADKLVVKEVITDPVRRVLSPGLWIRATPGTGQN